MTVTLRSSAKQVNLVAFLYDLSAEGQAALITRGASTHAPGTPVSFDLYPQDWRVSTGHRLGILLAGSDDGWFSPGSSGTQVNVRNGDLAVPFLRYQRTFNLPGTASQDVHQRVTFKVDASVILGRTLAQMLRPRLTTPGACQRLHPRVRLILPRHIGRITRVTKP